MPRENSVPVRGRMRPSLCVCVCVCVYFSVLVCVWAWASYSKSWKFRCVHHSILCVSAHVFAYTVNVCAECVCVCVCLCVYVCPSLLGKVIHHSKHQMTSLPTPILQLLPFHPPHILHSDGLAVCHHPPSSSSSSSSSSSCPAFNSTVPLREKCWLVTAGHSIYKADMGQA